MVYENRNKLSKVFACFDRTNRIHHLALISVLQVESKRLVCLLNYYIIDKAEETKDIYVMVG